jgi:hypothetical protein
MDFFRHVLPIDGEYQPKPKAKIRIFFFVPASFRSSVVRQFESNGSRAQLRAIAWSCYAEQHDRLRPRLPRPSTVILLRVSAMRTFGLRTAIFLPALGIPPLAASEPREVPLDLETFHNTMFRNDLL